MKVVITGSSGFIGSHLLHALKHLPAIKLCPFQPGVHSLFDPESLKPLLEKSRIVYHLAGANRAVPHELMGVNVIGTLNVLEAMRQVADADVKLVFLSSFQVYRPTPEPVMVDESFPLEPETLYGISKKMGEDLIGFYAFPSVIFRSSNTYGPGCRPYYHSVISTFCDQIVRDRPLTVNGTGEQLRDFIYIDDVISALIKTMEYTVKTVEVFNLCSGRLASLKEVTNTLQDISGKEIQITSKTILEDYRVLKGNNEKVKEMLNWSPEVDLREGLEQTYRWFERGNR
ncbi:MAG: NAD-dependent epimerase/dehydratase family protein [Proteobacteria bacterium]|nr:NAD-dependent epimerase/dehydratase family protein [Pseudomonadota bacterium]